MIRSLRSFLHAVVQSANMLLPHIMMEYGKSDRRAKLTLESGCQDLGRIASCWYRRPERAVHLLVGSAMLLLLTKVQASYAACSATPPARRPLETARTTLQ